MDIGLLQEVVPSHFHHNGVCMATIRKLQSGKWQTLIRRRGQQPQTKTFLNRSDAEKWGRLIESEIERGVFIDRSTAESTTLAELIDRYIEEVTPHKKSALVDEQRLRYLKRHFGHLSAAAFKSQHVAEWRDKRLKEGKAGATIVKEINSLSHLIDTAIKDWGIGLAHNPVKLVRKPKQARGRNRRLSSLEELHLTTATLDARTYQLPSIIQLAIETGMRLGEMLRMEWPHISLEKRTATLYETKNGEVRIVPLSSKAVAVLQTIPRHITEHRVFWNWKKPDSFEKSWRRQVMRAKAQYLKECEIQKATPDPCFLENIRFHDLRHEATSRFFEKGLNVMEVATITGHKTLSMLMRYTHLRPESLLAKLG